LEKSEVLSSFNELYEGKIRRYYKITPRAPGQFKRAKLQLMEQEEVFKEGARIN
jgi:hypothetical protein